MQGLKAGPAVPAWLAAGLIGLVLGGAGGFYYQNWTGKAAGGSSPPSMSRGGMGGGGMGGGGMGGGQQRPNTMGLVRTVGALDTLEKARGHELTEEQRTRLKPLVASMSGNVTLTEDQAEGKLKEINAVLNPDQQALVEEMTARPGGRGGGAGGPGGPGGGGYPGGMGRGGGMGGPGGGQPNPNKPFAEGRGKERLDSLLKLLEK